MLPNRPSSSRLTLSEIDPGRPIHLAGVAGSAMSGLALLLRQRGFRVVGTDPRAEGVRERLESAGVEVHPEQDGRRIPANAALVVATAAIPLAHPELEAAARQGIRVVRYAEMLGALMAERRGVAIAGTHGKTTTTSMVVACLRAGGSDPGFVIGGFVPELGASAHNGGSPVFVAEACEYDRSFLNLSPRIAVITNIEEDHLDVYADLAEIQQAFSRFASAIPEDGLLISSAACPNTRAILSDLRCRKRSFGVEAEADCAARNVEVRGGRTVFDLFFDGRPQGAVRLSVPGRHNVANALAALAVCRELAVPFEAAAAALERFSGASRRFDLRGEAGGVTVIDDYAHHPTEIRALLESAATRFPDRRLWVVFQPHQSSRTRVFLKQFAAALARADRVVIPDIYSVRDAEEERNAVHARDLVAEINASGGAAVYGGSLSESVDYLSETLEKGDLLLTVGAGDVDRVAEALLTRLSNA